MRTRATGVFVGREVELEELSAGLEDAFAGRGRLFLISGEPGIGKSRLADELANHAVEQGAVVLVGRCWEAGGAPAFWPWVQALRALVRGRDPDTLRSELGGGAPDLAQILPELRNLVPGLPAPPSTDPEGARFRLLDAVVSFLRNTAREQPVVLVLDDLHAADEPSLLLLRFVARELGQSRVLVAAAYRDVDPTLAGPLATALRELAREPLTRTLPLSGLTEPEVADFIELTTAKPPAAALAESVHAETEGNPLFVGEIVRLLSAEGRLDDAAPTRIAIPQSVKEVIGRRLRYLSDECNRVLTLASVLGREFDVEALARVSAIPSNDLLDVLEQALVERAVAEVPGVPGRLRFAHALIRDTLYDEIAAGRRILLHLQIGEALEALYARDPEAHLAELAHHFSEAAPAGAADKAIDYARRAGHRAVALLAYEEAIRLYRIALEALAMEEAAGQETRCELLLFLGDAQTRVGDESTAKATFLEAAAVARALHSAEQLARAALGYGGRFVWARAGSDERLVPLLEEALTALPEEDSALRVRVLARLAGALRDQHEREPRAALSEQAVEMARRLGDPATLAYALDGRKTAIFWPENPEERIAIATELIQLAEKIGERERAAQGCYGRLMFRLELGDMPSVKADLEAYARLTQELKQPAQRWLLIVTQATLALFEGRFSEAEELIEEALALGRGAQRSDAVLSHRIQQFALATQRGGLGGLEETLKRSIPEYPARPMFRCLLAALYAELGRESDAREIFEDLAADRFAALPLTNEWLFSLGFLAEVAAFLGEEGRARVLYELLLPYAFRNASTADYIATGSVSRPLGILASALSSWDDAARHFEDALAMNQRMGARPWVTHAQHDYARMLLQRRAAGDSEKAAELLRSSLATCRELGMGALMGKASTLLSELEPVDTSLELKFAGYRIEDEIGRGGMAVVYRATDLELDRHVALKLIAPELAEDERFRERFLRESRLAASLDHGNVIPIYEAGEADGQLFLAMRYVEGEDLKSLLRREGKLAPERAVAICAQAASALDAAHRRGLVHRDVKPGNVLLDEEEHVYLADFGLTKELARDSSATATGQLVGTLDYLAPEQIRGEDVDGRTDQYALACALYECLAGEPPFRGATEAEVLWGHMQEQPPPLSDYSALGPVFAKGLAKRKEERCTSCVEFVNSARAALGLEAAFPRRPLVPPGVVRYRWKLLVAGALILAGGITAAAVELTRGGGAPGGPASVVPDSVAVVDPQTERIVGQVRIPGGPSLVAAGRRLIWVASDASRTVSSISTDRFAVTHVVAPNATPSALAAEGAAVWVLDGTRRVLVKIDPTYGAVTRRIELPREPPLPATNQRLSSLSVFSGAGALWVTDGSTRLLRIDPESGEALKVLDVHEPLDDVAVGAGAVWAISGRAASVFQIDTRARAVQSRIPIVNRLGTAAPFPVAVAVGEGSVWVLNGNTETVSRIDPTFGAVTATISLGIGSNPSDIAAGGGAVWVANGGNGTLARIDPSTNTVTLIPLGSSPAGVAVGGDRVWASVQPGFRAGVALPRGPIEVASGAQSRPLPASSCSPVEFQGKGQPRYLIASDLPFQGQTSLAETLQMADAIRFVLAQRHFRAGPYSVGYQSCDDSISQTGDYDVGRCRANARAYAATKRVIGVIGSYNSGCTQAQIGVLAEARGGPLAMISETSTYVGLTHAGPGTAPGEPEKYYPHGVRNFVRVVAADDLQGAADALLAKRLGVTRLYVLNDADPYGFGIASNVRHAATKLGISVVGFERWDPHGRTYTAIGRRVKRAGADAVFLGGYVDISNGAELVKSLRATLGERVRILTPDGFTPISAFAQLAGPAAEGVTVSFPAAPPERLRGEGQRFVAQFGKAIGRPVEANSAAAAQATEVLLDAIARSDGARASVTRQLFKTKVSNGILGSFSFDRNGDTTAGAVTIYRIVRGSPTVFEVITPSPSLVR